MAHTTVSSQSIYTNVHNMTLYWLVPYNVITSANRSERSSFGFADSHVGTPKLSVPHHLVFAVSQSRALAFILRATTSRASGINISVTLSKAETFWCVFQLDCFSCRLSFHSNVRTISGVNPNLFAAGRNFIWRQIDTDSLIRTSNCLHFIHLSEFLSMTLHKRRKTCKNSVKITTESESNIKHAQARTLKINT